LLGEDGCGVRVIRVDYDHVPLGGLHTCRANNQRWDS
jgi:hypothetical protein